MSLIKVVPYVLGVTPGVPGAPEPRMYPCSGYFLVKTKYITILNILNLKILMLKYVFGASTYQHFQKVIFCSLHLSILLSFVKNLFDVLKSVFDIF